MKLFFLIFALLKCTVCFSCNCNYDNVKKISANSILFFIKWKNINAVEIISLFTDLEYEIKYRDSLNFQQFSKVALIDSISDEEVKSLANFNKTIKGKDIILAIPLSDSQSNVFFLLMSINKKIYCRYVDFLINYESKRVYFYNDFENKKTKNSMNRKFNSRNVKKKGILLMYKNGVTTKYWDFGNGG